MMKKLPVGIQNIRQIIEENYIYVDKTDYIFKLIDEGKYYFLSRPRRFGKSLLISTLKEIFNGDKELFKGLWIYDRISWEKYPVIHIDFSKIGHKEIGLKHALENTLNEIAASHNLLLEDKSYPLKFSELIKKLKSDKRVVLLIDEYDKPIIDYLGDIPKAEENRDILKNFYSVIKGNDENLQFVFLTGVSKFSHVSIFSDLNNLNDITTHEDYAQMLGYTQHELDSCFEGYIQRIDEKFKNRLDLRSTIKSWYNGYSWDGANFVYNPFSILKFFSEKNFGNFWYATGTPTFLLKLLKKQNYDVSSMENLRVTYDLLEKYEIGNIDIISVLFQTGYLTMKSFDRLSQEIELDYPNNEVRLSFHRHLLAELTDSQATINSRLLGQVHTALKENNIPGFIGFLRTLFAGITYPLIEKKENYYHSVFYVVIKLLGFDICTEVLTNMGRIDAVVTTEKYNYIIEFKLSDAITALTQIKEKKYHEKYTDDGRKTILLGIGFDVETKNIGGYEIEVL